MRNRISKRPRTKRCFILVVWAIVALSAAPLRLDAYNQSGHMETVRLVVETSLKPAAGSEAAQVYALQIPEEKLVEFCAQLPDLTQEIDATRTYTTAVLQSSLPVTWISWGWFNHPMNDDYRRMIAVQQLQHALTGGDAAAMRRVAISAVATLLAKAATSDPASDRTSTLCALGLAFHLYGDSFAHAQMAWKDSDAGTILYATGRGHAFDDHFPDYILCNFLSKSQSGDTDCHPSSTAHAVGPRFAAWLNCWTRVEGIVKDVASPRTLLSRGTTDEVFTQGPVNMMESVRQAVLEVSTKYPNSESDADIAVGTALQNIVDSNTNEKPESKRLDVALETFVKHSNGTLLQGQACKTLLAQAASLLSLNGTVLADNNCRSVWDLYTSTVIPLLKSCDASSVSSKNLEFPECDDTHKALDSSWESWLQQGDMTNFAARVQFD